MAIYGFHSHLPLSQGAKAGAVMFPAPSHRAKPTLVHQGNNRPPTRPSAPLRGHPSHPYGVRMHAIRARPARPPHE